MRIHATVIAALCTVLSLTAACGSTKNENVEKGMSLVQQMKYEDALTYFDAALINKEDAQLAVRGQGLAYLGLTQYDLAEEYLEQSLTYSDSKLDQLDFDINYYLATAYYKQGKLEEARKAYEAIVTLRPKEKTAHYLKGVVQLEQGNLDGAKEDFDKAVAIDPKDYDMRINIYCSCSENGQEEMGNTYLQAVLDSEDKKLTDYNKGRMYFYLGDYNEARNSLEAAKDTANTAEVISLLGQTYEKVGDYNYAASVYSNYLMENPTSQIYNQLGLCELTIGDYEDALNAFQSGIAIDGNQLMQTLKFNEIVAYEYLGQFDQAAVLMKDYLSLYPDDEKAIREYEFLRTR